MIYYTGIHMICIVILLEKIFEDITLLVFKFYNNTAKNLNNIISIFSRRMIFEFMTRF